MTLKKLLLCVMLLAVANSHFSDINVDTGVGTFIGYSEEIDVIDNKVSVSKFLGIPYAEPPVGSLRFRKPIAKKPLKAPYRAQQFGNACLQNYVMFPPRPTDSEDCLFLNIFRPDVWLEDNKLPVMVWFHGGGFLFDTSETYVGDALAANGPVIVVTLNYRLTAWGFLNTEDPASPGNYGLWDQRLAIMWVHQHIEAFGGDLTRVTLFGESAGGSSVIFQGLYPENIGLFHRMIAESGTASAHWSIRPNPRKDALKLASLVGCENSDTITMVDCLRNIPSDKLNATINTIENWEYVMPFPFVASVDDEFIPTNPKNALNNRQLESFSSYDLMIGLNSGEGATCLMPSIFNIGIDAENFLPNKSHFDNILVPRMVYMVFGKDAPPIVNEALIAEYTDWDDPENPETIRHMVCNMVSDMMFLVNTHETIREHAARSGERSYLYYFNILPYISVFPRPTWSNKPLHFDELLYVFGNKMKMGRHRELQPWEKLAAYNIMTMWTNFAKTGNPNKPRDIGVDWLPYTPAKHRYLEIYNVVPASKVKERLKERAAAFWGTILPGIFESAKHRTHTTYKQTCSKDEECTP